MKNHAIECWCGATSENECCCGLLTDEGIFAGTNARRLEPPDELVAVGVFVGPNALPPAGLFERWTRAMPPDRGGPELVAAHVNGASWRTATHSGLASWIDQRVSARAYEAACVGIFWPNERTTT